jgi:uncharacterized protein YyaL (SSP411 family)
LAVIGFSHPTRKTFLWWHVFTAHPRYGIPAFGDLLTGIERLWKNDRAHIEAVSLEARANLQSEMEWAVSASGECSPQTLESAVRRLVETYDWEHGGWGNAPRFPAPMSIDFLLTRAASGDESALAPALHALRSMARGGMYDLVGGGFHRYSTDDNWLVPHFEKMLYDNAQLAQAYLHGFLLSGDPFLRKICEETLQFIKDELTHPDGGFYSSLDADSENEEGKFYLWSFDELRSELGQNEFELLRANFDISPNGNFEGKIILRRLDIPNSASRMVEEKIQPILVTLNKIRARRSRPAVDDKVLTFWNALAIQAFAEAGRYLNREDLTAVARRNAAFLLSNLVENGSLLRTWRQGQAHLPAFLEDYSSLAVGLLSLYQADFDQAWYNAARRLAESMVQGFQDPTGGFFATHAQASGLVLRPKDRQDNATPAGNSMAATALLILSAFEGNSTWQSLAEIMLSEFQDLFSRYPTAFGNWLKALNWAVEPIHQVVITYPESQPRPLAILDLVNQKFRPASVLCCSSSPLPQDGPQILSQRQPIQDKPTVFICRNFFCELPLSNFDEIKARLAGE